MKRARLKAGVKRRLLPIIVLLYSVIILLLISLNILVAASYSQRRDESLTATIRNGAAQLQADMEVVDQLLSDIYIHDNSFSALQRDQSFLSAYGNAYELSGKLKELETIYSQVDGYFIQYGDGDRLYWFDTEHLSSDVRPALVDYCRTDLQEAELSNTWTFLQVDGRIFGLRNIRRDKVMAAVVIEATPLLQSLQASLSGERLVFLYTRGSVLPLGEDSLTAGDVVKEAFEQGKLSFQDGPNVYKGVALTEDTVLALQISTDLSYYLGGDFILVAVLTVISLLVIVLVYRLILQLTHQVREEKMRLYEETIARQDAQMQYYSIQLQPHFYLNGLKSLYAYSSMEASEKMQEMILNLSNHMRYILDIDKPLIPLEREIEYVKNYVELRRAMSDQPICLQVVQPTQPEGWFVPPLCIQTFVENSIKYACPEPGKELDIYVYLGELQVEKEPYLDIMVVDNGIGYPKEVLEQIMNGNGGGIGIQNLKARLEILYEGRAECNFYNDPGAVSNIVLPYKRRDET